MSYRAIVLGNDTRYSYWMCEIAAYSFNRLKSAEGKLTCVYSSPHGTLENLKFPPSYDTFVAKDYAFWDTDYKKQLWYPAANKPFGFYEYLLNNKVEEDNLFVMDHDSFFLKDLEERVTDPNVVRLGYHPQVSVEAPTGQYILKRFVDPSKWSSVKSGIGIYLIHRDSALDLAKKWSEWTEKIVRDKEDYETVGWITEAWAFVLAAMDLGIDLQVNDNGLQCFAGDDREDPVLHFYYIPKVEGFVEGKTTYIPWTPFRFDENQLLNHGKIQAKKLTAFLGTLSDLGRERNNVTLSHTDIYHFEESKPLPEEDTSNIFVINEKTIDISALNDTFAYIVGDKGQNLGFAALRAPFRFNKEEETFEALRRRGMRFIGMTSYLTFPEREVEKGDERNYGEMVEGWCHCFKDPELYLPSNRPCINLSESDLINPREVAPNNEPKIYDFIYTCNVGSWYEENKNWHLMQECLPVLCDKMDLRGVLVGRKMAFNEPVHCNIDTLDMLPQDEFWDYLSKSKMLIVPSIRDASPRVITEALCMNIPVIVNANILGGWKYVAPETGTFFEDSSDIEDAVRRIMTNRSLSPRIWFMKHYGNVRSGIALYEFLKQLNPDIPRASIARLSSVFPRV